MHTAWLSPSVMCIPAWDNPGAVLRALENAGVELLHADVMDGTFVPNFMLGTDNIKSLRAASAVPLDIHLMVEYPDEKLDWFDIAPGEYVSVHAECTRHLQRTLSRIRDFGAHPAVALNPSTPLCMIEDVISDIDMLMVMAVNPGFAGQKLVPQMIDKIARARRMLDEAGRADVRIEVDGNVSFENAVKMRRAGADIFVCGTSSIFSKSTTIDAAVKKLRSDLA